MTKEEYIQGIEKIESDFKKAKSVLVKSYALSNNPYKPGDIIKDHTSTIKIEKIMIYISLEDPSCIYEGPELKKDGTPKLPKRDGKQIRARIYQSNIQK